MWSQNEFDSVLHWFEDLAHPHLWCVANLVGVLVPKKYIDWIKNCLNNMVQSIFSVDLEPVSPVIIASNR